MTIATTSLIERYMPVSPVNATDVGTGRVTFLLLFITVLMISAFPYLYYSDGFVDWRALSNTFIYNWFFIVYVNQIFVITWSNI